MIYKIFSLLLLLLVGIIVKYNPWMWGWGLVVAHILGIMWGRAKDV